MLSAEGDNGRETLDLASSMTSEADEHSILAVEKDEMGKKSTTPVEEFSRLSVDMDPPATEKASPAEPLVKKRKLDAKTTPNRLLPYTEAIAKDHEFAHVYEVVGKSATFRIQIKRRDPNGYKFHPSTIRDLLIYHQYCQESKMPPPHLIYQLVAKLSQDNPAEDLVADLKSILFNPFISAPVGFTVADLEYVINHLSVRKNYGVPESKYDALNWELKTPQSVNDPSIALMILADQEQRKQAHRLFLDRKAELSRQKDLSTTRHPDEQIKTTMERTSEEAAVKLPGPEPVLVGKKTTPVSIKKPKETKPNAKLSTFFSVVKKTQSPTHEGEDELFQPFFAKPNQTLAPTNFFPVQDLFLDHHAFTRMPIRMEEAKRRKRYKCLGFDSKPEWLIVKLLQFHTNYRPAYFGTWRSQNSSIKARRPFSQAPSIDYEYDSDDDWGEDAEISDAESISDSGGEYLEGEDGEDLISGSEVSDSNNWVVPDGYISDDEGLQDGLSRHKASLGDNSNYSSSRRRDPKTRYLEKDAIICGPFIESIHKNFIPDEISRINFVWMNGFGGPLDLFKECHKKADGDHDREAIGADKVPKTQFTDEMLPLLAQLVHNSILSIPKLYEEFSEHHYRVSKRQFELKLNQIAARAKFDSRICWQIRPEYSTLCSKSVTGDTGETITAEQ